MAPRAAMMATMAGALAVLPSAMAGFDPESKSNVAVYWGQNSFGAGDGAQEDLSVYCDSEYLPLPLHGQVSRLCKIILLTKEKLPRRGHRHYHDQLLDRPLAPCS